MLWRLEASLWLSDLELDQEVASFDAKCVSIAPLIGKHKRKYSNMQDSPFMMGLSYTGGEWIINY